MARVKLCDVIVRANTKVDKDNTDLIYYVGGEHFESGNVTVENKGLIAGSTIGPMFYYGFRRGQFLLVSRNPHLKKAGVVDFDGICSEKTFVLETADPSVLLPEYLPFVLQNDTFWDYAVEHKHGSTNFFINWSTLANYEFELPSLEVQKRISKLAWAAHNLKKSYRKQLVATDELVKSQFIEMFGDQKSNPYGFEEMTLDKACTFFSGTGFPNDYQGNSSGDYPFYKVGDISRNVQEGNVFLVSCDNYISNEIAAKLKGTILPARTVVFAKIGEALRLNRRAITVTSCLIDNNAMGIKPNEEYLNLEYFFQYMLALDMGEYSAATAMPSVRKSTLQTVKIIVPPRELQERFSCISKQSDKSKLTSKYNQEVCICLQKPILK